MASQLRQYHTWRPTLTALNESQGQPDDRCTWAAFRARQWCFLPSTELEVQQDIVALRADIPLKQFMPACWSMGTGTAPGLTQSRALSAHLYAYAYEFMFVRSSLILQIQTLQLEHASNSRVGLCDTKLCLSQQQSLCDIGSTMIGFSLNDIQGLGHLRNFELNSQLPLGTLWNQKPCYST